MSVRLQNGRHDRRTSRSRAYSPRFDLHCRRQNASARKPSGRRVSELEQKLAEAENINRVQRSRLSEERRAAATANRINDQLQQRLESSETTRPAD